MASLICLERCPKSPRLPRQGDEAQSLARAVQRFDERRELLGKCRLPGGEPFRPAAIQTAMKVFIDDRVGRRRRGC
jgi:hypothetical protein